IVEFTIRGEYATSKEREVVIPESLRLVRTSGSIKSSSGTSGSIKSAILKQEIPFQNAKTQWKVGTAITFELSQADKRWKAKKISLREELPTAEQIVSKKSSP